MNLNPQTLISQWQQSNSLKAYLKSLIAFGNKHREHKLAVTLKSGRQVELSFKVTAHHDFMMVADTAGWLLIPYASIDTIRMWNPKQVGGSLSEIPGPELGRPKS